MRSGTPAALAAFTVATTLVTLAAFVVPALFRRSGRASRIVISSLAWNALVIVPIYVLGMTDWLYRGPLAALAGTASAVLLGVSFVRLGTGLAFREIGRTALAFVRLPFDAFRIAMAEGSFATVVVTAAFFLGAWLTAQAVLEPTWGDWDCLWYHEPMIGFAIQNHGFDIVPVEPYSQNINGFPRLSEMTMLWFGIFHGRWAIDLVNPLFLPLLALSTYAICRDLGASMASAIGFGAAMVLVPGVVRLVSTTMVDPHASALFIAATFFACRRDFDLRDALLGIVAVTLALGAKTFLVIPGFFVCLTLLVRILRRRKTNGTLRTLAVVFFGVAATLGILAFTHLRNYLEFHNPFWPGLRVDIPEWDIHWPGLYVFDDPSLPTGEQVNADVPWSEFAKYLFALPFSVSTGHNWQIVDYGAGIAFSLFPIGMLITAFAMMEGTLRLTFRRLCPDPETRKQWATILRLAIPLVVTMLVSPAPYVGRYHLAPIAMAMGIVSGHAVLRRYRGLADGIMAVVAMGSIATVAWNTRGWIAEPAALRALAMLPVPARYVQVEYGSAVRPIAGIARERELGPGAVVAYDRIAYLSLLWNEHYSNRVIWLDAARDPLAKADELGATWVYASRASALEVRVNAPNSGWTRVDVLDAEGFGSVYRRVPRR